VVEQAVAAGHQVTAYVRNADEYQVPNIRVVEGDATEYKRLQELKRQFDPTNLFRLNLNITPS